MNFRKSAQLLLVGALILGAVGGLGGWLVVKSLDDYGQTRGSLNSSVSFRIQKGSSLKAIAKKLEEYGLIASGKKFYWFTRLRSDAAERLQAGFFIFSPHMSPNELLNHLQHGKEEEVRVTIPEGTTKEGIAMILLEAGLASAESLNAAFEDQDLIRQFGVPAIGAGQQRAISGGLEGYLFPDTYLLPKSYSASAILWQMRNRLSVMLPPEAGKRMAELGLNLHQVMTLASLIEMEAADASERSIISGVFYNRLQLNMKLQTDPSVVYGIKNFKGKITRAHLRKASPYNTYLNFGLPPGPIASPGQDAIIAALWPRQHQFLYFVSRNDGTHEFCPTLKCHNQAVQKWQIKGGRSPRSTTMLAKNK